MSLPGPVLHVVTRLEAGGVPLSLLPLLEGLHERGLEVELATGLTEPPARDMLDAARTLDIPLHVVPSLVRDPHPLKDLTALFTLRRIMLRGGHRVVHTHTSKGGFIGRLAGVLAGVPVRVYSPHGTILEGYFTGWKRRLFTALERRAARWTHAIVGLTPEESRSYLEAGIGEPSQHVQIPVSIDPAPYRSPPEERRQEGRRKRGIGEDEVVIVNVGRLVPVKDQATLLHALALLPGGLDWSCWFIGDGPDRDVLETLSEQLGVGGRVRFLGHREDVPDLLPLADIFALTSVNEGFGRVILEAFAAHLAVIATRVGGVPTVVEEGRAGMLVPPKDPEALAARLRDLIRDREARERLVREGEHLLDRYSRERVVSDHIALYRRLSDERA
ncbi:MAG: glycosyltransferase [bacterium]